MTVLIASAVASSLDGVSTNVLPKYFRVNVASLVSSLSSCLSEFLLPVPILLLPLSTHSLLFANAHSSHNSENIKSPTSKSQLCLLFAITYNRTCILYDPVHFSRDLTRKYTSVPMQTNTEYENSKRNYSTSKIKIESLDVTLINQKSKRYFLNFNEYNVEKKRNSVSTLLVFNLTPKTVRKFFLVLYKISCFIFEVSVDFYFK